MKAATSPWLDSIRAELGNPLRFLSRHSGWAGIALGLGVLWVYLRTLSPGVLGGDAGELQFVPYILSLPHPTGTPLYSLLGKLWSALPLGPGVAWRMNLLAAVSASLAVAFVYASVRGMIRRQPAPQDISGELQSLVIPLAAAFSLAFGLTFWEQAVLADKYAFNALMVSLVLYLALRWGRTRSPATLNLLALAYGLSLAHHRTMALFAPALLGYVWGLEGGALWRDRRRLLRLAILCLAPLLLYLYLPWAASRGLPPGTWQPRTARQWYAYLSGFTDLVYIDPRDLGERLIFYTRTLQRDFSWIGLFLGVVGLIWQFRRRWPDATFLLANFILQAFLAANFHVPSPWVYFIPPFLIFALWIGEGLIAIWAGAEQLVRRCQGVAFAPLLILSLAMLIWPLTPFRARYRPLRDAHQGAGTLDVWRQNLKQGYMADRVGRAIAQVDQDAIIVCDWEQATALWYFQQVERLRPDVQIIYPVARLDEAAARGRPLYITRNLTGLADRWRPSASASLIALRLKPVMELPAQHAPLGLRLGEAFELAGFAYGEALPHPEDQAAPRYYAGTVLPVTLYWRALKPAAHDYSVSLRLFDAAGSKVFQVDSQHAVLGAYPTSRWTTGEVVADYYEMQLSRDLAPGSYRWGVVLYRGLPGGGWENLKVAGTDAEVGMGGSFEVVGR